MSKKREIGLERYDYAYVIQGDGYCEIDCVLDNKLAKMIIVDGVNVKVDRKTEEAMALYFKDRKRR